MGMVRKTQLLELVKLMEDSGEYIATNTKHFDKIDSEEISEMLVACQEAACTIGNSIEELGEVSKKTVALLEDYCELLYQQALAIENENEFKKYSQKINAQLINIRNSINNDLPQDKKEIVFMPYKASMWDSLESVWLAANEDDRCNAVVVPIPYFSRTDRGTFGEMHYEGNEFPEYVPITDWQTYDLSAIRPDAIYIHNPYDGNNFVTSVHPAFYSSELKKYTDCLVYIPYFVAVNDNVGDHFCTAPGVLNADKVILQSSKVREKYKEIYINYVLTNMPNITKVQETALREFAEKKFLALGSPKFDKVTTTQKDIDSIPDEWKRIITKENGEIKKIIFYNTTINALLKNSDVYLDKLKSVLSTFKENKNVALLWRPHPLLESTIQSMLPHLLDEYRQIVADYKSEAYGIFDDTADMNRAVAVSDAYYGDWSSVVELYKKTGKPIMIQSMAIR